MNEIQSLDAMYVEGHFYGQDAAKRLALAFSICFVVCKDAKMMT